MAVEVSFARRAQEDFTEIAEYLEARNLAAAETVTRRIEKAIRLLAVGPLDRAARDAEDVNSTLRSLLSPSCQPAGDCAYPSFFAGYQKRRAISRIAAPAAFTTDRLVSLGLCPRSAR